MKSGTPLETESQIAFFFVELAARRNGIEMVIVTCEYLCKTGLQWKECWNSFDGYDSKWLYTASLGGGARHTN